VETRGWDWESREFIIEGDKSPYMDEVTKTSPEHLPLLCAKAGIEDGALG
jgi:hypothetical protein